MVVCLFCCSVAWLFCCLVVWLFCCLVAWLLGCLVVCFFRILVLIFIENPTIVSYICQFCGHFGQLWGHFESCWDHFAFLGRQGVPKGPCYSKETIERANLGSSRLPLAPIWGQIGVKTNVCLMTFRSAVWTGVGSHLGANMRSFWSFEAVSEGNIEFSKTTVLFY